MAVLSGVAAVQQCVSLWKGTFEGKVWYMVAVVLMMMVSWSGTARLVAHARSSGAWEVATIGGPL